MFDVAVGCHVHWDSSFLVCGPTARGYPPAMWLAQRQSSAGTSHSDKTGRFRRRLSRSPSSLASNKS